VVELKVAVSATEGSLDAQVDPRFGRCSHFVVVDAETMVFEAIPNVSAAATSGAGIQAAQTVADRGVQAVITGNVGPNAYQVLSSAGIKIMIGASGTVREAVERFKSGSLQEAATPGPAGFGMGRGRGRGGGMGRGFGRGMSMTGGMGMGGYLAPPFPQTPASPSVPTTSEQREISKLEDQMNALQQELEQLKKRISELKGSKSD